METRPERCAGQRTQPGLKISACTFRRRQLKNLKPRARPTPPKRRAENKTRFVSRSVFFSFGVFDRSTVVGAPTYDTKNTLTRKPTNQLSSER